METRPGKGVIIEGFQTPGPETLSWVGLGEVFESRRATLLGGKINDLSMPVHSLLTRNDLQLICSQEQQPKGNFPPSLNRFLIDYQLQSGKATGLTCRKDAKYMEGQWSLLSHYLLPKFSSPRY